MIGGLDRGGRRQMCARLRTAIKLPFEPETRAQCIAETVATLKSGKRER